ncbi:hypothetical protein [Paraburkholderia sp. A3RO-2L]|jgi:hypothetical protein|uniref:hypothetical protein n=1 Tax=Paraburkholderia sp. A3RO-2L TaxID=3028376 RepID=UPI003DA87AFB
MGKKVIKFSALALAAGLMGASMAYASEAPAAHQDKRIIRMTTATVFGQDIQLVKYEQGGQVCQQFIGSATETEKAGHFTHDISIDEVCDVPELRHLADGTQELFPRKLGHMVSVVGEGTNLELPEIVERVM